MVPTARRTAQGLFASLPYRVNTGDPVIALGALGLPAIGSGHPSEPSSVVVAQNPTTRSGGEAENTGFCYVVIEYAPIETAPGDAVAEDGSSWTELNVSTGQVPIERDIVTTEKFSPATNRELNTVEITVRAYKAATLTSIAAFLTIANKTNSNTVILPPIRGVAASAITASAGQLLARTLAVRPVRANLAELSYVLGFGPAEAWKFPWQRQDQSGTAIGSVLLATVQESATYPALW